MSQFRTIHQRCTIKKGFLKKISQNSQENTSDRVSFLIKLQALACIFIKSRRWDRCFTVNFVKFLRTPFTEYLLVTASVSSAELLGLLLTEVFKRFPDLNSLIKKQFFPMLIEEEEATLSISPLYLIDMWLATELYNVKSESTLVYDRSQKLKNNCNSNRKNNVLKQCSIFRIYLIRCK